MIKYSIFSEEELLYAIEKRLGISPAESDKFSILELITSAVMDIYAFGVGNDNQLDYNLRRHVERTIEGNDLSFDEDECDYSFH